MTRTSAAADFSSVPVIDIGALVHRSAGEHEVARAVDHACRTSGFFYVVNHGVDAALEARLRALAAGFFAQPEETKMRIAMAGGGRAWRGYFPVGAELTSGKPDLKEGLYFGAELDDAHEEVRRGTPLHGKNLFPAELPELRRAVLSYMAAMTELGHAILRGFALGLGLPANHFFETFTADPLVLFRIFHYPSAPAAADESWGVGEHTDYGLLTILAQDDVGGLEVRSGSRWIAAPPVPGSFICNLGDMLEKMTGGHYRSTPHRVRNRSGRDRYSMPFFFDPGFRAEVKPVRPVTSDGAPDHRWDGANVHAFEGTYGDYLLAKVGKVFPELRAKVIPPA